MGGLCLFNASQRMCDQYLEHFSHYDTHMTCAQSGMASNDNRFEHACTRQWKDLEDETLFVTDRGLAADGSLSSIGSVTKQHAGRATAGTVLKSALEPFMLAFFLLLLPLPD